MSKSGKRSQKKQKHDCPNVIYLDNNGTTLICKPAAEAFNKWIKCYNVSTNNKLAKPGAKMIDNARHMILSHCGVSLATHTAIFTSGASESNCFIIRACVEAVRKKLREKHSHVVPHVILSSMEHNASMSCVKDLVDSGYIEASFVKPTIYGNILSKDVKAALQPNTCLVSIIHANNEVPVINNIAEIAKVVHASNVPLHTDAVQLFGKYRIDMKKNDIDVLSASAHKLYGPKGIGLLVVKNELIEGYGLKAEINGSQQNGLRGGTENVPAVASFVAAIKYTFSGRKRKNKRLFALRDKFLKEIVKHFKMVDYKTYLDKSTKHDDLELVSLGPPADKKGFILCNTLLIAVCKNKGKPFCNVDLKKALEKKKCIVSIGSACNTHSKKASHVMDSIGAPPVVRRGVIRISFGDSNTLTEVLNFVKAFKLCVLAQCKDLKSI